MKVYILLLALFSTALSSISAGDESIEKKIIEFIIEKDESVGEEVLPRTQPRFPFIFLQDHTLYLCDGCENIAIEVRNYTQVVYNSIITDVPEKIQLPTNLSGTYEINIIRDNIIFKGYIEL